jgi:hypothetical protein
MQNRIGAVEHNRGTEAIHTPDIPRALSEALKELSGVEEQVETLSSRLESCLRQEPHVPNNEINKDGYSSAAMLGQELFSFCSRLKTVNASLRDVLMRLEL